MLHYEMNTGWTQRERRLAASEPMLPWMERIYDPGSHSVPLSGFRVEGVATQAGRLCMVIREPTNLPLVTVAVAEGHAAAEKLWPNLVHLFDSMRMVLDFHAVPASHAVRPPREPWYATLTMFADPGDRPFLSSFCRRYAWGWIDYRRRCLLGGEPFASDQWGMSQRDPRMPAFGDRWRRPRER